MSILPLEPLPDRVGLFHAPEPPASGPSPPTLATEAAAATEAGSLAGSMAGSPSPCHLLTRPRCTGARHRAEQMPQSSSWASSESPPATKTKVSGVSKEGVARGSEGG